MADTDFLTLYQNLIRNGMSPLQANKIASQPSQSEQQVLQGPSRQYGGWNYPYAGEPQEARAGMLGPDRTKPLTDQIGQALLYQGPQALYGGKGAGMNLPTYEGSTPGDDDSLGFQRLPNGQYVPTSPSANPQDLLNWYQRQGNPNSFYWNPTQPPGAPMMSFPPGGGMSPMGQQGLQPWQPPAGLLQQQ